MYSVTAGKKKRPAAAAAAAAELIQYPMHVAAYNTKAPYRSAPSVLARIGFVEPEKPELAALI